ncbi:MAG: hypothetical protein DME52_10125 [Verrucomicrobia bacterium]|jgi:hypothetical protein|nr:MAG: hypothetical protein DME52_10125 [Verrucomicrobiota bacterium]PYK50033.1 MAG: hypothetical protein DME51_06885 [Verrucomicrobiota bacterium]
MKKILFVLSMLAFVVCALPQARGDDVSVDFFYNNLSGGNWIDVEGYGYGWQPDVAVSDPNWRPYSDGYWAYTDYGWTWISYEDFGWATYHYGRWANLADNGWVWIPGSDLDWGPAWVSWRTGGDYIGWAPLPPRGADVVYEGQPIGASVDVEYDIGPQYYNFCDIRFIGEPVLRDRIFPPTQNITYITNTVNVTNIYVQNNVVYNYGPNYNVVNEYSSRPIQRLTIERQTAGDLSAAAKSGALTKVQGNKLVVAAPLKLAKSPLSVAPPAVKAKVAQPKIEHGWKGVSNRAEVEQKIKAENPKNIPPPTRAAARTAGSPPAVGASPPAAPGGREPVSPGPRGKPGRVPPGATAVPAGISPSPFERGKPKPGATAAPAGISPSPFERGKPKPGARPGATTSPAGAPAATAPPASRPSPPPREHGQPPPRKLGESPSSGAGGRENIPPQRRGGEPERERFGTPPPAGAGAHERRGPEQRPQPAVRQPVTPPPTGAPPAEARGARERAQGAYGQPGGPPPPRGGAPAAGGPARGGAPAAGAERGQEQPQHGKKQPEKGTPRPGPQ